MNRYESRYCTFVVPNDWVPLAPFGFAGPGDEDDRMTAQAMERWLEESPPAADYARRQAELLPALYDRFEILREGPYRSDGPGDGHFLAFRFRSEEGDRSLGKVIYLVQGPLVCDLTLTGLDGPDPDRDRLFEAIGKTFSLRGVDHLARLEKGPLLSEDFRRPDVPAWPGPRRKFPRACVSLPVPSGWEVADEDGQAVFRRGGVEIRLRRVLGSDGDVDDWFGERMKQLQETESLLLRSERGALERGDYAALLFEEKGASRRWNTAAVTRTLELFIGDEQPLLWTLHGKAEGFSQHLPLLEQLALAAEFLPPAEWETKLAEPWIDLTLKGPWRTEGPGVYVTQGSTLSFLYLNEQPNRKSMADLAPHLADSVRQGSPLRVVRREKKTLGLWRGRDAFRYSSDGSDEAGEPRRLRVLWTTSGEALFTCLVQGSERRSTDSIFLRAIEGIKPSMKTGL